MQKLIGCLLFVVLHCTAHASLNTDTLKIKKVTDFKFDGVANQHWDIADWHNLIQLDSSSLPYDAKFKILYSDSGIYVMFSGKDHTITSTYTKDFEDLFRADVFEVFFHPEPKTPIYLEYEVNALNAELVLLIPNVSKKRIGWAPWKYTGKRKVIKKVQVLSTNDQMQLWTAELFFPFSLFVTLQNIDVHKGTCWNANFYRLDYDTGDMIKWAWSPVIKSFHEYEKFGVIQFD